MRTPMLDVVDGQSSIKAIGLRWEVVWGCWKGWKDTETSWWDGFSFVRVEICNYFLNHFKVWALWCVHWRNLSHFEKAVPDSNSEQILYVWPLQPKRTWSNLLPLWMKGWFAGQIRNKRFFGMFFTILGHFCMEAVALVRFSYVRTSLYFP